MPPLDDLAIPRLDYRATLVRDLYTGAVSRSRDRRPFPGMSPGSEGERSALKFFLLIERSRLSGPALMDEAVDFYDVGYCRKRWKQPYPPFYVVIGQRSRSRLWRNWKPHEYWSASELQKYAKKLYDDMTGRLGPSQFRELVESGWPQDVVLRRALLKEMKRGDA